MRKSIWFMITALLLSSCLGSKDTSTPTPNAQVVLTSVQITVYANLTSISALTPSATITPTITETLVSTTSVPLTLTPSLTSALTSTLASLADKAELINQLPPDHSKFNTGAPFNVTWTFKNVGTTTWTTDYAAKFWSDDLMGSPNIVHLSTTVKPNDTIDITMTFNAPSTIGSDKSSWWLQNAEGVNFFPFFIAIEVVSALPTPPTATTTDVPTVTATIQITPTMTETPTP